MKPDPDSDSYSSPRRWWQILAEPPFRHPMGLRPGNLEAFLKPGVRSRLGSNGVRSERRRWLEQYPERHLLVGERMQERLGAWEARVNGRERGNGKSEIESQGIDVSLNSRCFALGCELEFDWLVLDEALRLVGGAVCFPSSWAPEEKLGLPLTEIHAPVPGLNEALGKSIQTFLERLKPGTVWERSNWGWSRNAELNQHPLRNLPRLDESVGVDSVWLRVEHQFLWRFEGVGGFVFGIAIESVPLSEVLLHGEGCERLFGLLETMPMEVVRYKGLESVRPKLVEWLQRPGNP